MARGKRGKGSGGGGGNGGGGSTATQQRQQGQQQQRAPAAAGAAPADSRAASSGPPAPVQQSNSAGGGLASLTDVTAGEAAAAAAAIAAAAASVRSPIVAPPRQVQQQETTPPQQQQQQQQQQQTPPQQQQQQLGWYNPRPASPALARVTISPVPEATGAAAAAAADGGGSSGALPSPPPRIVTARVEVTSEAARGGASSLSSVATLCNSAVGAGVLALPFAFRCAGLVGGIVLCALVAASESFALYVLSKMAERFSAHSYGSLVRRALGRKTASALSAVMLLYLAGSCVAYLVIVGDTASSLAAQALGSDSPLARREALLPGVALLVVLPMCFARSLAALEWVSAGAVAGFLYTSGAVLLRGAQAVAARSPDPWAGVALWQADPRRALYAVSILVFGFNSSANTVSIFSELEPWPHRLVVVLPPSPAGYAALPRLAPRPATRKLIGMLGVILVAMGGIALGYVVVGAAGYAAFPGSVGGNVLNAFPADDPVVQVARGVIGLMVTGHYPLAFVPARVAFNDLLASLFDVAAPPAWADPAFTLAFVLGSLATALAVTDLGAVLHLVGGTAAAFMIFALPGLLCWNAAVIKHAPASAASAAGRGLGGGAGGSTASLASLAAAAAGAPGGSGGGGGGGGFGGGGGDASDVETASAAGGGGLRPTSPLLVYPKKAGLREHGVLFLSSAKTWWAGLFLISAACACLAITLLTLGGGAPE